MTIFTQFGSTTLDQGLDIYVFDGNSYILGITEGILDETNKGESDFFISKYDDNNEQVFLTQFGTNKRDIAEQIIVSDQGIFIVGNTEGILGNRNYGNTDFFIANYTLDGAINTSFGTNGFVQFGSFQDDNVKGFAIDSKGNFYLAGYTEGSLNGNNNGGRDAFIAKYNSDGTLNWIKQFGTEKDDLALDLVLDIKGNIYVTGYVDLGNSNYNGWVAKYNNAGTQLWQQTILDNTNSIANGYTKAITIDEKGNLYAAGLIKEPENSSSFDVLLTRFTPEGQQVWVTQNGTQNIERIASDQWETAESIDINTNGNIVVSGYTLGYLGLEAGENQGGFDAFVATYGQYGNIFSLEQTSFSTAGDDYANGVTLNDDGQVYVTGSTSGILELEGENQGSEDIWLGIPDPDTSPSDQRVITIRDLTINDPDSLYNVSPTEVFTVYLDLNNAAGLLSADFILDFDPSILQVFNLEINFGSLINDFISTNDATWNITANINVNGLTGRISTSMFGSDPLPFSSGDNNSLLEITFIVKEDAPSDVYVPVFFSSSVVSLNENGFTTLINTGDVYIEPDILQILDFTPTYTGFEVTFSRPINLDFLNLYGYYPDPEEIIIVNSNGNISEIPESYFIERYNLYPDVIFTNSNGDIINGSLLWDESLNKLTFVATGGLLPSGDYNVTLKSGYAFTDDETFIDENTPLFPKYIGFVTKLDTPLDGNNDGSPGDDFTTSFTINDINDPNVSPLYTPDVTLLLPDFSRGPGQEIDVPSNDLNKGLPLTLTTTNQEVSSLTFNLNYDPEIIKFNGVFLDDSLLESWKITSDFSNSGVINITLSGNTFDSNFNGDILFFDAEVLETAVYNTTSLIEITDFSVNDDPLINAVGDRAIHQVTYVGDVTGNGSYSGLDQAIINSYITVEAITGFEAFPRVDPVILGDVTEDDTISGLDSSLILRAGLGFVDREIPTIPEGLELNFG